MKRVRIMPQETEISLAMETPTSENPSLFDTTPKERHHLNMYRKLTPKMQSGLDDFLEDYVPDSDYEKFMKK